MDGLSRAIGAGTLIKHGDKTYEMSPLTLADYGLIEQHLLSQSENPFDAACKSANHIKDPVLQEKFLKHVFDETLKKGRSFNSVSFDDIQKWLATAPGMVFSLWLCLRKKHQDVTQEKAAEIFQALGEEITKQKVDQASGTDLLGNSTGLQVVAATGQ